MYELHRGSCAIIFFLQIVKENEAKKFKEKKSFSEKKRKKKKMTWFSTLQTVLIFLMPGLSL